MLWIDKSFEFAVDAATDCLMQDFLSWNQTQERLAQEGEDNNFYEAEDVEHMRFAFKAIAARFVLEDVNPKEWAWLSTSWAGVDGNTGRAAYVVDFIYTGTELPDWAVLSFYATSSKCFWYANPLAETDDPRYDLATCEVNSVRQAIKCITDSSQQDAPEEKE